MCSVIVKLGMGRKKKDEPTIMHQRQRTIGSRRRTYYQRTIWVTTAKITAYLNIIIVHDELQLSYRL